MRRPVLAVLAFLLLLSSSLHAQTPRDAALVRMLEGDSVGRAVTDDQPIALLIRYVGSGGGTVTVAANGDITLKKGTVASSAVDTNIECDASIAAAGSRSGIIDVSVAACDTLGEVVDIINSQSTEWRAVIVGGLRADSSNDTLLVRSETTANAVDGLPLYIDTDVALVATIALTPSFSIRWFINGVNSLKTNPYEGLQSSLFYFRGLSTYGSGTSTMALYCVDVRNSVDGGSETVTTKFSIAAGATTVDKVNDFTPLLLGIPCNRDQKALARITNSAAMATTSVTALGYSWRYR